MVFKKCVSTFYGNISFISNTAMLTGGAIGSESSVIAFSGRAVFHQNQASGYNPISAALVSGGAIALAFGSFMSFGEAASVFISQNKASFGGGAISVRDSELSIQGDIFFEVNFSERAGGGAIIISIQFNYHLFWTQH